MSAEKEEVVEEFTRPVIKLLISIVGLFILRFIITSLPGLGANIPNTPITFATLAGAIISVVMIAIVVNFGREIEPRLQNTINGPTEIVNDLSAVIKFLIYLLAAVIAYDGLSAVAVPFLVPDPGRWVYDIVFLVIALIPTTIIAQRMFGNLDEVTDLLTKQVKSAAVNESTCGDCGESVRESLEFCPNCGNELDDNAEYAEQESKSKPTVCEECGSDIDSNAEFCGSCGAEVTN